MWGDHHTRVSPLLPTETFQCVLILQEPTDTPLCSPYSHLYLFTKSDLPVIPEHFRHTDTTRLSAVFFLLYFPSLLQVPSRIGYIYLFVYSLFHPYPREYMLSEDKGFLLFTTALPIGEGNGTPLQYSCLENPMDGGVWWAVVHGVAKSRT